MTIQTTHAVLKKILSENPENSIELARSKRKISKEFDMRLPTNAMLLKNYNELKEIGAIKKNLQFERLLVRRKVRTGSGVAPVTVLTKPFPCPGKCVYCPTEPGMPKSYLSNEPAAMRAVMNRFDPYDQITNRLRALTENGHTPDKIDLIILGGTWSSYAKDYQEKFIHECYRATNDFGGIKDNSKTLSESQNINETAAYRMIGLCIETRPDHVCIPEIKRWRNFGVTRVQLGAQHLDDNVQKITNRGHYTDALITATKMIKDAGFKLDYHIMQNLPGSNPEKDLWCAKKIVSDQNFQPDQIKIYPTIVNEYAELYEWFKDGRWKPYSNETLASLLVEIKKQVPYHIRINRVIRDFPGESIIAGNKITNLRELLQYRLAQEKVLCKCIRCTEAKEKDINENDVELHIDEYDASDGKELFIVFSSKDRSTLYAFCRLRLPGNENAESQFPELHGAAIIRELHTFGRLIPIAHEEKGAPQHSGLGKRLMKIAEAQALSRGFKKCAVISGVGVREYYYKMGYTTQGTYVTKDLC
jgi:elongator complex protein 3